MITKIKDDADGYRKVLKNLIIQGFIKLFEENINIICKKEDYNVVCGLVEPAKNEFLEKVKIGEYISEVFKMYSGQKSTVTLKFDDKLIGTIYDQFGEDTKANISPVEGSIATTLPTFPCNSFSASSCS